MNKNVLIRAGIVTLALAVLIAGYLALRAGRQQQILQYVPADTALFVGSVKPVDLRKYLDSSQWALGLVDWAHANLEKLEKTAKADGPFAHFLVALYLDYLAQFRKGPDQFLAHYGFAEKNESAMYLVGAVPVGACNCAIPRHS